MYDIFCDDAAASHTFTLRQEYLLKTPQAPRIIMLFAIKKIKLLIFMFMYCNTCNISGERHSIFRYDVSKPLLEQIKSHCRTSKIAQGSCKTLYTTLHETITSSYCTDNDCPTRGYVDFPLKLQDVMTIFIDDQPRHKLNL